MDRKASKGRKEPAKQPPRVIHSGGCVEGSRLDTSAQKYDAGLPQRDPQDTSKLLYRFRLSRNPKVIVGVAAPTGGLPFSDGCETGEGAMLIGQVISGKSRHPIPREPDIRNRTGRHKAQFVVVHDAMAKIDAVLKQYENLAAAAAKQIPSKKHK